MNSFPTFNFRGKEFEVRYKNGTVLSSEKRSETSVSASGGGRTPVSVSSSNTLYQDLWINNLTNGAEEHYQIVSKDIALRQGQEVNLIFFFNQTDEKKPFSLVGLINVTGNQRYNLMTKQKLKHLGLVNFMFNVKHFAVGAGVPYGIIFLISYAFLDDTGFYSISILSPMLLLIPGVLWKNKKVKELSKALGEHVTEAMKDAQKT